MPTIPEIITVLGIATAVLLLAWCLKETLRNDTH